MSELNNLNGFLLGLTTGVAVCSVAFSLYAGAVLHSAVSQPPPARSSIASNAIATSDDVPSAETIERLHQMFTLSGNQLNQIVKHMIAEMKKGLSQERQTLLMIPSHVVNRPTGAEKGSFLALDLGGTNFRVCEVVLDGHSGARVRQSKHTITDGQKLIPANELFDFFADCTKKFLIEGLVNVPKGTEEAVLKRSSWKLGFTFSFAVDQHAIDRGVCVHMGKGYQNPGVVGSDVVVLLQEAFKRKQLNIEVKALVNDTTGTLMSHAYVQPSTRVGVILGTGTNCAYVEKIENIPKYKGDDAGEIKEMIINTEWGTFDDEQVVIPRNKYDKKVDRHFNEPGKATFEKMISGMYLGEIVRYTMVDLVKTGELFPAGGSHELDTPRAFETSFMSRIERDHTLDLSDTRSVLEDMLKIPKTTLADRRIVKTLCELVGKRSARLSAAGVAAVVTKMNKLDGCTVGIDGSLFELYPHFSNRMRDALREILGISAEGIVLEQARDGSGQGAALIAALADQSK